MNGQLGEPTVIAVPTVVTGRLILRCWRLAISTRTRR